MSVIGLDRLGRDCGCRVGLRFGTVNKIIKSFGSAVLPAPIGGGARLVGIAEEYRVSDWTGGFPAGQ
ncbi:MAG TPA: hypothetical protein VND19_22800 [Acetobacteraceae bacterium]|nr:hypothetical protein [Acetobacteraceae bacterium]